MNNTKVVIAYCGHYRKALLHPHDHESSNNECCFESRVKVSLVDWEEQNVQIRCPSCQQMLYQSDDHFIEDDGRKYTVDNIIDLSNIDNDMECCDDGILRIKSSEGMSIFCSCEQGIFRKFYNELDAEDISHIDGTNFVSSCEERYKMTSSEFRKKYEENGHEGNVEMWLWYQYIINAKQPDISE